MLSDEETVNRENARNIPVWKYFSIRVWSGMSILRANEEEFLR